VLPRDGHWVDQCQPVAGKAGAMAILFLPQQGKLLGAQSILSYSLT